MGRRGFGLSHVDSLPGSAEDRERLRVILRTLSEDLSVAEASARLSVSESRFAELRTLALTGALSALAPKPAGRPRKKEEEPDEVVALRRRVKDLELDLACACVKTEIALVMPKLLVREEEPLPEAKKGGPHPTSLRLDGASSPATSRGCGGSSRPSSPPSATARKSS
jgi:transposase